jgi:YidC/Oxa1 family membrane protein insertase
VSVPGQKDQFTPLLRMIVAWALCIGVFLVWAKYFGPKPPVQTPQANRPMQSAPATPGPAATSPRSASQMAVTPTAIAPATPATVKPESDSQERTIVIENDLYRVEISNRGAVVKSWQLKQYKDDARPQRVLDVVHPDASQMDGWPFSLVLDDESLQNAANAGLYRAWVGEPGHGTARDSRNYAVLPANPLKAPTGLECIWSDGHLEVTKHFQFDHDYVVRVDTSAKLDGRPIRAGLGWLGGFGDVTVKNPVPVETVNTFYSEGGGKISTYLHKKLDGLDKWPPGVWQGGKDYVGIEDRYFTAAFLPANGAALGTLDTRYWKTSRTTKVDGQDALEPIPEVATSSSAQPLALRVYVGPKDYDDLKKLNPPLHGLVNFGWFEFIADPLFHALKWLHNYIPNWGWAIVVLTLLINMVLFPLRISSYKTTLKMQRVAPEVKAIQDKYKKYKLNDPKKAEMNKEVMAVYQREGINPVGGCIPQLLQMPIWFALYRALQGTIEIRHGHWLWITDLSAKDPYYILPVLMGLSMYLVSKMTPMTSTDPQQQAMLKIMPIGMAGMFVVIPYPSGLAVYILTSSMVGIAQQWYLNRTHPLPPPNKIVKGKKS